MKHNPFKYLYNSTPYKFRVKETIKKVIMDFERFLIVAFSGSS